MPAKESVVSATSLCLAAALSGCSVSSSADPQHPATAHSAVHSARAAPAFTVAGVRPVPPNGSQDTHAHTPTARCDSAAFAADKDLGARVVRAFALAGLPASADLLRHFLSGDGAAVAYRPGSAISKLARARRLHSSDRQNVVYAAAASVSMPTCRNSVCMPMRRFS